jgi:solute carrier family 25 folate transporter 32
MYTSLLDAFRTIWNQEGWRAFYKGLGASLLGTTHVIVMFPLYEAFRSSLAKQWGSGERGKEPVSSVLVASIASKMVASAITYPHEVMRTRLHTSVNPVAAAVESMASAVPTVRFDTLAIYGIAPRYESAIGLPHPTPVSLSHHGETLSFPHQQPQSTPTPLSPQTQSNSRRAATPQRLTIRTLGKEIWQKEGYRGFYKGFSTNLLKTVPATAATMLAYETVKKVLVKMRDES